MKWKDELPAIKLMLSSGNTVNEIANGYGVTRARLYQILQKYGIETPEAKKTKLFDGEGEKYHWLNAKLTRKGFSQEDRLELLEEMSIPEFCPILGIKLNYSGGNGQLDGANPSIDRIDNSIGYTKDNIHIISLRANKIKNDATLGELTKIVEYLTDMNI